MLPSHYKGWYSSMYRRSCCRAGWLILAAAGHMPSETDGCVAARKTAETDCSLLIFLDQTFSSVNLNGVSMQFRLVPTSVFAPETLYSLIIILSFIVIVTTQWQRDYKDVEFGFVVLFIGLLQLLITILFGAIANSLFGSSVYTQRLLRFLSFASHVVPQVPMVDVPLLTFTSTPCYSHRNSCLTAHLLLSTSGLPPLVIGYLVNLLVQFLSGLECAVDLGSKSFRTRDHNLLPHF